MQVTFENLDKVNVLAHITIPASDVNPIYNNIVAKYQKNGSVPGFRKGKCPERVLLSKYGAHISEEVAQKLVEDAFPVLAKYEELAKRVGMPAMVKSGEIKRDCDFAFDFKFEVEPTYERKALNEIEIEKIVVNVTDEDVDSMIEMLRNQYARIQNLDDVDTVGDEHVVEVKFVGTIDGVAFEGGSADKTRVFMSKPESMIPGFIEQIKGHKIGETFNINVTFPEDYHKEDLAGKPAVFETTINSIAVLAKPDDEKLCSTLGVDSFDKLKKDLRNNMSREGELRSVNLNWENIGKALVKANGELDLPNSLIQEGKEEIADKQVRQFSMQLMGGVGGDKQKAFFDGLREHLLEQITEEAAKAVALEHFYTRDYNKAEQINTSLDKEVIENAFNEMVKNESSVYEDPKEFIDEVNKDKTLSEGIRYRVIANLVQDAFFSKMNTTVKTMSFAEVQKLVQAEAMAL